MGARYDIEVFDDCDRLDKSGSTNSDPVMNWLLSAGDYTIRDMSYQSDVLIAFWSMMDSTSTEFGLGFVAGLCETDLDAALMWQPLKKLRTREAKARSGRPFPSWSWSR